MGQGIRFGARRLREEVLTLVAVGVALVVSVVVMGNVRAEDWRFVGVFIAFFAVIRGARWWAEATSRGALDSIGRTVLGNFVAMVCLGAAMRWILGEGATAVWVTTGLLFMIIVAIDLAVDRGRRKAPGHMGPLGDTTT